MNLEELHNYLSKVILRMAEKGTKAKDVEVKAFKEDGKSMLCFIGDSDVGYMITWSDK